MWQQWRDFPRFRETSRFRLRVDSGTVHTNFEDSPAASDEFGLYSVGLLQFSCYTSSLGQVVSHGAVFDFYVHTDVLAACVLVNDFFVGLYDDETLAFEFHLD